MKNASYEQIEAWRVEEALKILEAGRARQVSPAFDAPQFCRDWIELARKTVRATGLKVMVRDVKTDSKGNVVTRKKSTVPLMTWRPYRG